jgi:hypothetical protein
MAMKQTPCEKCLRLHANDLEPGHSQEGSVTGRGDILTQTLLFYSRDVGGQIDSLGGLSADSARLKTDAEGRENFQMAVDKRLIIREERSSVEVVEGTFGLPAKLSEGV